MSHSTCWTIQTINSTTLTTAVKVLTWKFEHITPVLKSFLLFQHIITFKMILLVHNALNSLAHYYISDWFSVYNPIRPLRSPGANLVTIRSKCAECFSYCGPFLWNTFSADVRSVTTVSSFRKKLSFWESLSVLTGLSYIHAGNHLLIAYRIKADSSLLADIPRSSCLGDHLMYLCIYYQVTYQSTVIFTLTGSCFSCPPGS